MSRAKAVERVERWMADKSPDDAAYPHNTYDKFTVADLREVVRLARLGQSFEQEADDINGRLGLPTSREREAKRGRKGRRHG
jgi:hypothetical protein